MNSSDYTDLVHRFTTLNDDVCEAEAIALGRQGDTALPVLTKLGQHKQADVRFWAVRALWANGSAHAIDLLINTVADKDEMVCSGTALALGELKAELSIEALGHILTTDPGASGNHATDALIKIGPASSPVLIKALKHPESWARVRAAKALIPLESHKAIAPLFHALDDESYIVAHYAQEALIRMGVGQMVYFNV